MALDTGLKFGAPSQWMNKTSTVDEFLQGAQLGLQMQRQKHDQLMAGQQLAMQREQLGLQHQKHQVDMDIAKMKMGEMQKQIALRPAITEWINATQNGDWERPLPDGLDEDSASKLVTMRSALMSRSEAVKDWDGFMTGVNKLEGRERSTLREVWENDLGLDWPPRLGQNIPTQARDALDTLTEMSEEKKRQYKREDYDATVLERAREMGASRFELEMLKGENKLNAINAQGEITMSIAEMEDQTKKQIASIKKSGGGNKEKRLVLNDEFKQIQLILENAKKHKLSDEQKGGYSNRQQAIIREMWSMEEDGAPTGMPAAEPATPAAAPTAPAATTNAPPLFQEFQNWQKNRK